MISDRTYQLEHTLDPIASSDTRFSGEKVGFEVKGFTYFIGGCSPSNLLAHPVSSGGSRENTKRRAVGPQCLVFIALLSHIHTAAGSVLLSVSGNLSSGNHRSVPWGC